MKTIVIATDFSESAAWATSYALNLAQALKMRIVIVHAYDPSPSKGALYDLLTTDTEDQLAVANRQLNELKARLIEKSGGKVNISAVLLSGTPDTSIEEEVVKQKANLLLMGLAGSNPLLARNLGSLATKMIPRTQVPMLLVPPGARYKPVHNIVLAVDLSTPIDVVALASAKRFARAFNATLDIICMENEPTTYLQKAAGSVRTLLSDLPHTFSFLPGNDLTVVLDTYLINHRAELIMLLPKQHTWFELFLMESTTQQVARQSTVPVLAAV